jgi:hypothetical protein
MHRGHYAVVTGTIRPLRIAVRSPSSPWRSETQAQRVHHARRRDYAIAPPRPKYSSRVHPPSVDATWMLLTTNATDERTQNRRPLARQMEKGAVKPDAWRLPNPGDVLVGHPTHTVESGGHCGCRQQDGDGCGRKLSLPCDAAPDSRGVCGRSDSRPPPSMSVSRRFSHCYVRARLGSCGVSDDRVACAASAARSQPIQGDLYTPGRSETLVG